MRGDIAISDGNIVEISESIPFDPGQVIEAKGLTIFPGVIDAHVHFNEPGRTDWEGFATGSAALAAGGGTCFIEMPLNASPPTLNRKSFELKLAAAKASSVTDFALWGGLTPSNLDSLEELSDCGVIGFKAFMSGSGIDDFKRADDETLYKGMEIASRLKLPVAVHAEDEELTSRLSSEAQSKGLKGIRDYLNSRPIEAELLAIRKAIRMAAETKCRLHIVHISSAAGVEEVIKGKSIADVTAETCPHYLFLNDEDVERLGAPAKCAPPIRSKEEVEKLWQMVNQGSIDIIGSDHSPAPESMKKSYDFFKIWGGIAGVQSTLSLLLDRSRALDPTRIAMMLSMLPANRFGLKNVGQISIGYHADFAIFDLSQSMILDRNDLLDRHRLSPYVGRKMDGKHRYTIVRGNIVATAGKLTGNYRGNFITPLE